MRRESLEVNGHRLTRKGIKTDPQKYQSDNIDANAHR